jgi:hypothetical protein
LATIPVGRPERVDQERLRPSGVYRNFPAIPAGEGRVSGFSTSREITVTLVVPMVII